ncbi:hypothetical protein ebA1085 [Aromatoleum aromaticum EbN1]|uniref:Uncharacterized protein n=1 Tax=Aromatoleum aromaticum (strain DSM 19018 / LMG 30748 / EbN1) TaxID=76114 RepID=Q5P7L7_AROAE|nr:hypothetical protein ebA1085 [Aromatoleum aromaticum EbN1]
MRRDLLCGRNVAADLVRTTAEEMLFHLFGEVLPCPRIHQVEAIFIDQHGLVLHPLLPGFLGHILENALAQRARHRRQVQPFRFAPKLDAIDHTGHRSIPSANGFIGF